MRFQAVVAAAVVGLGVFAGCSGSSDHTGFSCNSSIVSVSSDQCRERVSASKCMDGGSRLTGSPDSGTQNLCCDYVGCEKNPFPEYERL